MRDNIMDQINEFMQMCEHAYEEGCSEEVVDAWEKTSSVFGHIIPGYYDSLSGPESPRGDMRRLDLPLIAAKLRIYEAKLEYDAANKTSVQLISATAQTMSIDMNAPFNQVTERVVDDDNFTEEEKSGIFNKINELKGLLNSQEEKSAKWEQMKPVLSWLCMQDLRLASIFIPLVADVLK